MRKVDRLKQEARESCEFRGHKMKRFKDGFSECKVCKAWVYITLKPMPNDIDIGGPAVALHCPIDPKWL